MFVTRCNKHDGKCEITALPLMTYRDYKSAFTKYFIENSHKLTLHQFAAIAVSTSHILGVHTL